MFAQHAHAHVLEHRQAVGQHDGAPQSIELEAQAPGLGAERPVQGQRQRFLGAQSGDLQHVGHGRARAQTFAVTERKAGTPALEEFQAAAFAFGLDQRVAQVFIPAPRGGGELRLQRLAVHLGNLARRGAHREVNAREDRVAQLNVEFGTAALVRLRQDALELDAQVGRIRFARHVDEARHEALERVAAREQAQALAFAQSQDAHRGVLQVVVGNLEQVVARIGFQNVVQRFGQVAAGRQAGARGDGFDLAAQQRRFRDARAVRGGGEQADEAVLADHAAGGVVALDAHIVGVAGPVHRGARIRLRDQQQGHGRTRHRARIRRQRRETGRQRRLLHFAQHAQPTAGHQAQRIDALFGDEVVTPVAEERHVVVGEPLQEREAFLHLHRGQAGRCGLQLDYGRLQLREYRLPIAYRGTHVGEDALQAGGEIGAALWVDDAVDLDVDPRFMLARRPASRFTARPHRVQRARRVALDGEDRMHDQMQRQPLTMDFHRRAVHEKRHVVVDDVDHGVA